MANELQQLHGLAQELTELRRRLLDPPKTFDLRAGGSILHDFYNGTERLFERIASAIDSSVPAGVNWQVDLLDRTTYPIPTVCPDDGSLTE